MSGFRVLAVLATAAGVMVWSPLSTARSQQPTFRSGVDLVAADVLVVREGDGQPVTDLTPNDFALTVDGRPRPIVSVDLLTYATITRNTSPSPGVNAPPSAPTDLVRRLLPARRFLLAIDAANITRGGGRGATSAAGAFLDALAPNDLVGLVALPVGVAVEFTTDRAAIGAALKKVIGGGANTYEAGRNVSLAEAFAYTTGQQRRLWDEAVRQECAWARSASEFENCRVQMQADARSKLMAATTAGQTSVQALAGVLRRLTFLEGPTHVIVISEALVTGSAFGFMDGPDLAALGPLALAARANLYVLHLDRAFLNSMNVTERFPTRTPFEDVRLLGDGLSELAAATGGAYLRLMTTLDPAFARIARETSAGYVVAFQATEGDRDGKPHRIAVRVSRPGVQVRARSQFVAPKRPTAPPPVATAPPTPPAARPADTPAPPPAAPGFGVPPPVSLATTYLTEYLRGLSAVVSEERYEQRVERTVVDERGVLPRTDVMRRTLISDFLLVQLPGIPGWHAFRDVYSVDGDVVRDRSDRLVKLFIEPHADRVAQADRIRAESSRYNIGGGMRDINVPTFALQFLLPSVRGHFTFRPAGTEKIDGVAAQVVTYEETARPTIITGQANEDVPATGQFWLDPDTGAVLKTRLQTRSGSVRTEIDVAYRLEARLGLRVPAQMDERRSAGDEVLWGRATYSNFRRFTVATSEEIKKSP